jgi:hypothetical protein
MLRFNTYRSQRYLRSKFVEGKYLLASEGTDLQLELVDLLRKTVEAALGSDVAVKDAWKVEKLSATELLIKPGEAWVKGLPFAMRTGKDQLVSGAILSIGTVPVGVSVSDDANGEGKILTFNDGASTPTNDYKIIISAREELLTDVDDPFLKNVNLTESTAQKIRLIFQLNIVPVSLQTESPTPYRDETSTAGAPTNFPNVGGVASPNLVNQVSVTPDVGLNGEQISLTLVTGSEGIDGRDVEIVIRNDPGVGSGNPFPNSPVSQSAFSNGTLIDSNGNRYHVNAIFNDTVSTQLVIRVDKEPDQPNPEIVNTKAFTLIKRDVFVTDDVNGSPQGRLYWPVADVSFSTTNGIVHQSKITDLRNKLDEAQYYQNIVNQKFDLQLVEGGDLTYDNATSMFSWDADLKLINPYGSLQTIGASSVPLVDGGTLHYALNMAGGALQKGSLAINVTAFGATSTLSAVSLADIEVGNIVVDSAQVVAEITEIDDVNATITTSPALTANGAAFIYKDSYGPGKAPLSEKSYVLAARSGSKLYVGGSLELESGETSQIGDGVTAELLAFIGSTSETDQSPNYSNENYVSDGMSLVDGISALDLALFSLSGVVTAINWKAPVADYATLPLIGNSDGDVRITLDSRVAYSWDNANSIWKPLNGTGGGVKIISVDPWSNAVPTSAIQYDNTSFAINGGGAIPDYKTSSFTITQDMQIDSVETEIRNFLGYAGNWDVHIYADLAGEPDETNILATASLSATTVSGVFGLVTWTFGSPPILTPGTYHVGFNSTEVPGLAAQVRSVPTGFQSFDAGATWSATDGIGLIVYGTLLGVVLEFGGTDDAYLEIKGLDYVDNTIPWATESPIVFSNDYDVAYVVPNLTAGGPNLTVNVDTLANVPLQATIIARRVGTDVIVGSSSTLLKLGQSSLLYAQTSNQTLSYIGAPDTADSTPSYSSNIRGTSSENLTARAGVLTDILGDEQENRSAYFRSDLPITWTGTQLIFTDDIVLEIVNTKSGTVTQHTILAAESPLSLTDGESAWVTIDRTLATENLTLNKSGTLAVPAQTQATKDVIIFARRQDATGAGYLHLPLHKQVLEPGQTVRLGASGSGSGGGNEILETLKNSFMDSTFDLMTPNIFQTNTDDLIDLSSTGAYSLVDKSFNFTGIGQTLVSVQMLDALEFLADPDNIGEIELEVFWRLASIDTAATYEVSRNGGNEWQTIEMDRVGSTEVYRGFHRFETEASNQTLVTVSPTAAPISLNATTTQELGQSFVLTEASQIRRVSLQLNKTGSPVGKLTVQVRTDSAGTPSSTVIAESNMIDIASLGAGDITVNADFTSTLAAGTYHTVLKTDAAYKAGALTLGWRTDSGSLGNQYDGAAWTATGSEFALDLLGIALDLRVRITSSVASAKLDGYGIRYDKMVGEYVTGIKEIEAFIFSGDLNTVNFLVSNFTVNPELLRVYDVNSGQVYRYGSFTVDGQTVKFESGQFLAPGETVKLVFDQLSGGAFDNSDSNANLLASNHLGSNDATYDRSVAGRGILLRRPDGTLREITLDNSDNIVILSTP